MECTYHRINSICYVFLFVIYKIYCILYFYNRFVFQFRLLCIYVRMNTLEFKLRCKTKLMYVPYVPLGS